MKPQIQMLCRSLFGMGVALGIAFLPSPLALAAQTDLADAPYTSAPPSPVNLLFTPSVEFPTATVYTHKGSYSSSNEYIGYFDPNKCYVYDSGGKYFDPKSFADANHSCPSGQWSGNALNYGTMSGIDPFRWALTGGYRSVDTASTGNTDATQGITVLQRAYQGGSGYMTNRSAPGPSVSNINYYNHNLGVDFTAGGSTYRAAVRVCKGDKKRAQGGFLEDNCEAYQTSAGIMTYKPVGLIQRKHEGLRFGVFGYLYNEYDSRMLDGGVLRGRMKSVGSTNWDGTNNPAYEWSPTTGVFVVNPDTADAAASGVPNSGVINYLNKFGFGDGVNKGGYETHDQPSEMVAEALRYLMKKSHTPNYIARLSDDPRRKDNFPVITNWEDPILNGCQRNAILGIGDVNTHYEDNFGTLPFNPRDWTAKLNSPEGASNLQNASWGSVTGGWGGGNVIAGIAYYAHTQDIRPDLTEGKNTVDFFWVDVMEDTGRAVPGHAEYAHKNQYWLAAKYGGFKDVNDNGVFDPVTDAWKTQNRDYFGYELPDNYYPASDPNSMVNGLTSIFDSIGGLKTTAKGVGIVWQDETDPPDSYRASYNTEFWSGDVVASVNSGFDSDNKVVATQVWSAANKIDAQDWDTGRKIVTGKIDGGVFSAVPFRHGNLTAAQQASFDSDPIVQQKILNYLRGDRTGEGSSFRERAHVLGDIVHSKPVFVGAPDAVYLDGFNPGYSAFKDAKKTRKPMQYVGANDGMLHAIVATTTGATDDGQELWAYIPSPLYEGPSSPSIPEVDGLQALSKLSYNHRYYVDATPVVVDVDFNRSGTPGTSSTPSDWRTLLVGGLGKGGKGYFAIDITDPDSINSETAAASRVLWEFSPPDMGFTFGQASVVKTAAWGWVVLLTSGYNNASGEGILYIVNAKTGALIKTVGTGAGSAATPAGFTHINGYLPNGAEYIVSQVYGGDLLGNLWRFDLTDPGGDVPVHKLAKFKNSSGVEQPVTVYPIITRPPGGQPDDRWVLVATGQYLAPSDIVGGSGMQTQTMYAIRDGSQYSVTNLATIERSDLTAVLDLSVGLSGTPAAKGWYYDMPTDLDGAKERTWIPLVAIPGEIIWVGSMPAQPTASCNDAMLGGKSLYYRVDYQTGVAKEVIVVDGLIIDMTVVVTDEGYKVIWDYQQEDPDVKDEIPRDALPPDVINWRLLTH